MYDSACPLYFRNPTRSEMIKRFVISKVISKINDNPAYPALNKMGQFSNLMDDLFIKITRKFCR